jgi:hypothetical protein
MILLCPFLRLSRNPRIGSSRATYQIAKSGVKPLDDRTTVEGEASALTQKAGAGSLAWRRAIPTPAWRVSQPVSYHTTASQSREAPFTVSDRHAGTASGPCSAPGMTNW